MIYNIVSSALFPLKYETEALRVKALIDKSKPESGRNTRSVEDVVVINYFPPTQERQPSCVSLPLNSPAVIVEPGLTCDAQDVPGSSFLRLAVTRGFRVVVVERRGHRHPLTTPRWNLFGDSDDSEQVFNAVKRRLPDAPLFWLGISSGSKLPIEAMGKWDERYKRGDQTAPRFVATACVCPGYNLETCFLGFQFPYKHICLSSVQSKFLLENEAVLRQSNTEAYEKAVGSSDLQSLLTHVAPFAGYPSQEEYFAAENPVLFASLITTPTLIINAMDDPCTVATNAFGRMPGCKDGLTFVEMVEKSPRGLLLLSPSGSHCPFLDGRILPITPVLRELGGFTLASWADACVLEFFEGYLEEHRSQNS